MTAQPPPIVAADPAAAGWDGGNCRALFLDRDGVINIDHGYVHTPEATEWVPGIFDLARAARQSGYVLIVATNQAGIARGYYSANEFAAYTKWVHTRFQSEGAPLLATYYCPHHPTEGVGAAQAACNCRKPAPGMLLAAAQDWSIDLAASIFVGDHASDMKAAESASIGLGIMVRGVRMDVVENVLLYFERSKQLISGNLSES